MAVPNFFEFLTKRRSTQSPDDAYQLDQQQPRTVATRQTRGPAADAAGTVADLPKIDSNNVLGSLTGILGPSPEERAAEEKQLQEHRRKMHGWTALFNGLRHLGNLYYATKGAPGQKLSDPHQQIEQQYQDERRRLAEIHAANRNYYGTLYNIRRQMEDDKRRDKLNDAQLKHYQTQDDMARERSRQQDEYNEARKKYYEAISNKNDEQAEYWRLRAEGVPKESAAKIAKDYATAAKANRTVGGRGNAGTTKVTTWGYDEKGNKVVTTTTQPNGSSGNGKGGGSLLPGREEQERRGSLLP